MYAAGGTSIKDRLWAASPRLSPGPEHAATIAREAYTKLQVTGDVVERARFPLGQLGEEHRRFPTVERGRPTDALLSIADPAEAITVIVVAAPAITRAGSPRVWAPDQAGAPVNARLGGTSLRRVADLRR